MGIRCCADEPENRPTFSEIKIRLTEISNILPPEPGKCNQVPSITIRVRFARHLCKKDISSTYTRDVDDQCQGMRVTITIMMMIQDEVDNNTSNPNTIPNTPNSPRSRSFFSPNSTLNSGRPGLGGGHESPSFTCDAVDDPTGGLIVAVAMDDLERVEGLLANGYPVNLQTLNTRESALHVVCPALRLIILGGS